MIFLSFKKSFKNITIEGKFTFEKGFNVILGPSGAGKSTVIKVMCGIEKPDEGFMKCCDEVFFDTKKGVFLPPQKRRLGVVFQSHNLFPHMTVRENIEFALKKAKEPQFTVEELLEKFNLKGHENKYPGELSGGQRQRVAVIRAIVFNPRAVLMDEPFSSLDFKTKLSIMEFIKSVHIEKPVIIVTHDLFEALYLGQKFFLMDNGKKVKEGGKEVLKEYVDLEKIKKFLS
ncbi:ATP-binding cassette domain-containing protein [Aquifex aeolicus]|uniref:ABC transporter n=1 Tax=Aquifex aeolicus (strain VF5) TaxID=224324 RepID=O67272_AQUAE|nr:ABC transporter ATP-binding protein [Aquifex aeolicus]AAC07231.1 ABC transporter [Aquifex aeolicus VF5]